MPSPSATAEAPGTADTGATTAADDGARLPAATIGAAALERVRLIAACLAITLAVFAQDAGSVAADTKLDLVVDPVRFLHRALSLWDPIGSAGQLQDQAYGYLFPMGPFFVMTHALGLPVWVSQRGWETLIVLGAFLGAHRVARALGIATPWGRLAAAAAYALAPRSLSELFSISAELLPVAAAPWVLLPLITGAQRGSPRRSAALSAVALLFAGGINASATLAVLPVPALWLLTRSRGPRRAALMRWWALAIVLACAWWAIPLVLLGRYSPPFLDWIESSAVTTSQNSLLAVLRGTDHWQAYLGPSTWAAGWVLVVAPAAVFATSAVAALGLAGLARRAVEHRVFLVACLVLGLCLLTAGHRGQLGSPFALPLQTQLDGPLAAFRNIHKFDPVLRLPLAIGVGALVAWLRVPTGWSRRRLELSARRLQVLVVTAGLAVGVVAIGPVFAARMVQQPRTVSEPSWWTDAAAWLTTHGGRGRALVVPGSGTPAMLWGSTIDDPMQPVATTPWTARDQLPLAQAGYIRLLDAVDQALARGTEDPTLSAVLARSGIRWLVVRNDLDTAASQATRLAYVHSTLASSPGFEQQAHFGPQFGGAGYTGVLTDGGLGGDHPALQIYGVAGYRGAAEVVPVSNAVAGTGSGDDLPDLVSRGLGPDTPVLFGPAASAVPGTPLVVGDGIRRREIVFGTPGYLAPTMTAQQRFALPRVAHDYLPTPAVPLSTVRYTGIAGVTASSSGADVTAPFNRSPANGPYAAVDASSSSSWLSADFTGAVGQWLQVDLDTAKDLRGTTFAFTAGLTEYPSRIRITTDAGSVESDVGPDGDPQPLPVPAGPTRSIRITVLAMSRPGPGIAVGIRLLQLPGVEPQRTLDVPVPREPAALAFDVAPGHRDPCLPIGGGASCNPGAAAAGEEDAVLDRSFVLPATRTYRLSAMVRLQPSRTLDALLDRRSALHASASSRQAADPRVRPGAAVDGDPGTTWMADPADATPSLAVRLPGAQLLTAIDLSTSASAPVSRVRAVRVIAGSLSFRAKVPADGIVALPHAVRTDRLTVEITAVARRYSIDSITRVARPLPAGIGELTVPGVALLPPTVGPTVELGCAAGPRLVVDGRTLQLRVSATPAQALSGAAVPATVCGNDLAPLAAGGHRLRLTGGSSAQPDSLTAVATAATATPSAASIGGVGGVAPTDQPPAAASLVHWGSTDRLVRVAAGPRSLLIVHENANAGWQATLHGHRLATTTVDGWQQAYVLPPHASGTVHLRFAPQRTFVLGLVVGLLAVLLFLLLAVVRRRPKGPAAADAARAPAPVGDAVVGPVAILVGVGVASFVLLGVLGVLAAAVAVLAATAGRRRRGGWAAGPVLLVGIGIAAALYPPTSAHSVSDTPVVQLGCWFAVVLAVTSATASWSPGFAPVPRPVTPWPPVGRRWPRRNSGRSTANQDTAATAVADTAVRTNNSTA